MTIYVTHSRSFDFKKELYEPIRSSEFGILHKIILPHEFSDEPYSSLAMFAEKKFDLILAEVSYPSTGQGIELGWASSFGIPIIGIYLENLKYSGSLKSVTNSFFAYKQGELDKLLVKLSTVVGE
jgi:hypothetical protein